VLVNKGNTAWRNKFLLFLGEANLSTGVEDDYRNRDLRDNRGNAQRYVYNGVHGLSPKG
jgi:hypothetical protein